MENRGNRSYQLRKYLFARTSTTQTRYLLGLIPGLVGLIGWALLEARGTPSTSAHSTGFLYAPPRILSPLSEPTRAAQTQIPSAYAGLPQGFEANRGQADSPVKFLSRGDGYNLYLTPTEAVWVLRKPKQEVKGKMEKRGKVRETVLRMKLIAANPEPEVVGLDELPGKSNYFLGNDPKRWRTNIPTYARVKYHGVYPGVDLVYYSRQRQLEYDFVVAPGADPRVITLAFPGADRLEIDAQGNLLLHTLNGDLQLNKPHLYQEIQGTRQAVLGSYVFLEREDLDDGQWITGRPGLAKDPGARIGFQVAVYDTSRPLVIDPVLVYSTYLGGSDNEFARGIAVDPSGSVYVTGASLSTDFPVTNPLKASPGGFNDTFVAKLNPTGSALVYSSYLGGSRDDFGNSIAVDASGSAYVIGATHSTDFPTARPLQPASKGFVDAFVAKLDPTGSALVYSTYLGGSRDDFGRGIAVDPSGNAYITGRTLSVDFPTANPLQSSNRGSFDIFMAKLNPMGSALVYSTYLGGSGFDTGRSISVDADGNTYTTGYTSSVNFPTANPLQPNFGGSDDAFVVKLDSTGSRLVYSTYLGGSRSDKGHGIAVDAGGNAYVTGQTRSTNFPTANPLQSSNGGFTDAFVTKLNSVGSALLYSTYLGGSRVDEGRGIAVDKDGSAYVVGRTFSSNFPTVNPLQPFNKGSSDAFVAKLTPRGTALVYSTYLGGYGSEFPRSIAVDASHNAYIAGGTGSMNFPAMNPLQPIFGGIGDVFITKIAWPRLPIPVTDLADYNGDGSADIAVYRPLTGQWLVLGASSFPSFGSPDDIPTPGDYDGDGAADLAFWRPSAGEWHLLRSGIEEVQVWGLAGDLPVPGDYDGDQRTDFAVWRPSTGQWLILFSGGGFTATTWGRPGDVPVPADYDGDGKEDVAVFRPPRPDLGGASGTWLILNSSGGFKIQSFGTGGDFPVPGEYEGGRGVDLAIWRPSTGTWEIRLKGGRSFERVWGVVGDVPVQADFDGDGRTDLGVFRGSTGQWFILTSSSEFTVPLQTVWGQAGDIPVAASGGK